MQSNYQLQRTAADKTQWSSNLPTSAAMHDAFISQQPNELDYIRLTVSTRTTSTCHINCAAPKTNRNSLCLAIIKSAVTQLSTITATIHFMVAFVYTALNQVTALLAECSSCSRTSSAGRSMVQLQNVICHLCLSICLTMIQFTICAD